MMRMLMSRLERRSEANHGMRANYSAGYWTPPLNPRLAFDLESEQIAKLDMDSMVSLSDHDNIKAPVLLRSISRSGPIPVSVEWTVPLGAQSFHLGVHNLPGIKAAEWMEILADYTADPRDERLTEILTELSAEPGVLVVFNHPMWDLYVVGREKHAYLVNEFIQKHGAWVHALELNGLRHWDENRSVLQLSE